jgi:hypothetical protein
VLAITANVVLLDSGRREATGSYSENGHRLVDVPLRHYAPIAPADGPQSRRACEEREGGSTAIRVGRIRRLCRIATVANGTAAHLAVRLSSRVRGALPTAGTSRANEDDGFTGARHLCN